MFRVAVRTPVAVGVKVTRIVHSAPALRPVPQPEVSAKSPGLAPPRVTLLMESDLLWLLVSRTVFTLGELTVTVPKFRLRGEMLTGCVLLNITVTKVTLSTVA